MVGHAAEVAPETLMTQAPAGSEVCKVPTALVTPRVSGFSVVAQPVAKRRLLGFALSRG